MEATLGQLAAEIGGETTARVHGDPGTVITGVGSLGGAGPGDLTFLADGGYRSLLGETRAAAVVLGPEDLAGCRLPALVVDDPAAAFGRIAARFEYRPPCPAGVHSSAVVAVDSSIHPGACVGPQCVIGSGVEIAAGVVVGPGCIVMDHCRIGRDSRLVAGVTLGHGTSLGQRVLIHPGVVVGGDGFGFVQKGSRWHKVPQLGNVRVGNDVEIGANSTIDRGTLDDTVIEDGVKIDNQVQIGHNASVGADSIVVACVGISGSTRIGKRCQLGGGAGFAGHIEIVDDVTVTGMGMVTGNITEAGRYSSGTGLLPSAQWRKNAVRFRHLDALNRRVKELEREVERLRQGRPGRQDP